MSTLTAKRPPSLRGGAIISGLTIIRGATGDVPSVLLKGALAIQGDRILAVGPDAEVRRAHPELAVIDGQGFTAMPGLVNAHVHAAMGFFRGLAHDQEQMIERFFFPAERALTPELTEALAASYLYAGLRSGTTTFGEHYYFAEGIAKAADNLGVRAVVGETVADLGGAFPGRDGLDRWQDLLGRWPFSSRITPAIAPHAADTVSAPLLTELAAIARAEDLPLHLHLAQTHGERARVQGRSGLTPVAYADAAGALGPKTLAVHLVAVDDADAKLLRDRGVTAGICPASQILYEELAPLARLAAAGVPFALGTDCAASNDTADLLAEMRLMGLLAKDRGLPAASRSSAALFAMATRHGARALGLERRIGELSPGLAADVVFLADDLATLPDLYPDHNLIYSASQRQVRHVMVDGAFVLYNDQLTRLSLDDLTVSYREAVSRMHKRMGLTPGSVAPS